MPRLIPYSQSGRSVYLTGRRIACCFPRLAAYQQVPLEESLQQYVVIKVSFTTPDSIWNNFSSMLAGIFQLTPLGEFASRPSMSNCIYRWHSYLEQLEVLSWLEKAGLRAQKDKCQFRVPSVSYLGHWVDSDRLHPLQTRWKRWREPQHLGSSRNWSPT